MAGEAGEALEYASSALRADREVVLAAVRQNGWALEHASAALQADVEVATAAVRSSGDALQWVATTVKEGHPELCRAAVESEPLALEHVPRES